RAVRPGGCSPGGCDTRSLFGGDDGHGAVPRGNGPAVSAGAQAGQAAPGGPEGSAHPHQQPVESGTAVYGALPGAGCPAPGQADGPHAAGTGSLKSPAKG